MPLTVLSLRIDCSSLGTGTVFSSFKFRDEKIWLGEKVNSDVASQQDCWSMAQLRQLKGKGVN